MRNTPRVKNNASFFLLFFFVIYFFWDVFDEKVDNLSLYFIALLLVIMLFVYKKININREIIIVIGYVTIQGFFNVFVNNNSVQALLVQIGGIVVSLLTYKLILDRVSVLQVIKIYWKCAVVMSCIAIIQEIFGVVQFFTGNITILGFLTDYYNRLSVLVRVRGLCFESSALGYFLAPACCMSVFYFFKRNGVPDEFKEYIKKYEVVAVLIAIICTFSLVSYMGIVISFILLWKNEKIKISKIILPVIVLGVVVFVYLSFPEIRVRIDDTLYLFMKGSDNGIIGYNINLSAFTWYTAYTVLIASAKKTMFLGTGLGSCQQMYDSLDLKGWGGSGYLLNTADANSMFFRIGIELGLVGLIAIIFYIRRYFVSRKSLNSFYSSAILVLFALVLLRHGNYLHRGIIFFLLLYKKIWQETKLSDR